MHWNMKDEFLIRVLGSIGQINVMNRDSEWPLEVKFLLDDGHSPSLPIPIYDATHQVGNHRATWVIHDLLRIRIAVIPVYKPLPLTQFQHFLH